MDAQLFYRPDTGLTYSNYLNPTFSAPLDPRSVVSQKSALTTIIPSYKPYSGMLVIVLGDPISDNNGAYYLKSDDASILDNWVKIGSAPSQTGIEWPSLDNYDPTKIYYLKYEVVDDVVSPSWVEFEQQEVEEFRLGTNSIYEKTENGYVIKNSTKINIDNIYTEDNEQKTAEVIAVEKDDDSFYMMINPDLALTIDGGDSGESHRASLTVQSPISLSAAEVSSENPLGIQWLYDHNMVSSNPSDATITWYSDSQCQTEVGSTTGGSGTISDDTIYQANTSLIRYAVATYTGWEPSYIRCVEMSIFDDSLTVSVTITNTVRTDSSSIINS